MSTQRKAYYKRLKRINYSTNHNKPLQHLVEKEMGSNFS
jgi:hypothetical protein